MTSTSISIFHSAGIYNILVSNLIWHEREGQTGKPNQIKCKFRRTPFDLNNFVKYVVDGRYCSGQ